MKQKIIITISEANYKILKETADASGAVSVNSWISMAAVSKARELLTEAAKTNPRIASLLDENINGIVTRLKPTSGQ